MNRGHVFKNRLLIVFFWAGAHPFVSQQRSQDLNLWPWPLCRCSPQRGLQAQAACFSVISALWVNREKKRKTGTSWPAAERPTPVSLHNCKGLWDIVTFYCLCLNHLFILCAFLPRTLFPFYPFLLFLPFSTSCFPLSQPSFTYFPFRRLFLSFFSLHLSVPHLLILAVIPRFLS